MRACRLGLVDSSRSGHCSRLLLEPQERRFAAAILADASCLILPLSSSSSSSSSSRSQEQQQQQGILLRSPPCSDACFLRLHSREDPSSGSVQMLQFGQFGPAGDNVKLGRILFLLASSSKGGSCTDIRAWSCQDEEVAQIPVLGVPRGKSATAMVARLGIPHGSGIQMEASVNVVVLYSPSVGKVWILAAKTQESSRLLLITCAVIDCAEVVHTLHLSPQHLFLGENGGVRVLPLRPLVKGKKGDLSKQRLPNTDAVHPEEQLVVKFPSASANGLHHHRDDVCLVAKKNGFVESVNDKPLENGHCGAVQGVGESPLHKQPVPRSSSMFQTLFAYAPLGESSDPCHVVAIAAIAGSAFLILDSSKRLHCLTLTRLPTSKGQPKAAVDSKTIQVDLKRVEIAFPVSTFAVLPSDGAPRKMWVSDGKNSVHIFAIPDEMTSDGVRPTVLQAVFMAAQIGSLVAISSETVLAITEGAVVAYVKGGS